MMKKISKNTISALIREMYDDVKPGYSRMGTFDRPGPMVGSEKTILPELPILAQPQAAAQLSISLPDIDDADAVPVGPDLRSFMAALADRVPDEEAAKFYRLVRKHVEKNYGREHDDKIGKVEETKSMNDKQTKRIVEAVRRVLTENEKSEPSAPYFGAPGGNYFELKEYLEEENDTFEQEEVEVILDYIKGKYPNLQKYGFDIDEDWNDLVVYSADSGKMIETINYTDIEKEVSTRDEIAPSIASQGEERAVESEIDAGTSSELLGTDELGVLVRLEARGDTEGARIVYDASDELGDKEKNPSAYYAQQKQYIKSVRQSKVGALNFLGLSSTIQRAGRDGKGDEIKEVPYYQMDFALVGPGFRASSGYESPERGLYWRITIRTGYAPGNYAVLAISNANFGMGGKNYKFLGGAVGGKTYGAISGKELEDFSRQFKLENVKGSGFKMSKAKADEYQRMTGEKASATAKSSLQSIAPELSSEYPGEYKSDKDMTAAVKAYIDRNLFRAFVGAVKARSASGAPGGKADQNQAIDRIMNVLERNYEVSFEGESVNPNATGEGSDNVRFVLMKHYVKRDPLHLTSNVGKLFNEFNKRWKAEFNGAFSSQLSGPDAKQAKLIWDNRMVNSVGLVMTSVLASRIGDSATVESTFDVVSPEQLWSSSPEKFETQARKMGLDARTYYEQLLSVSNAAVEELLKLEKLPAFSDADVADWVNDMLKDERNQGEMANLGISITPKISGKKASKTNESKYFDKFMDRLIVENTAKKNRASEPGADMNARMRLRASREMEHHLHTVRFNR
jgi:hypothetical protein